MRLTKKTDITGRRCGDLTVVCLYRPSESADRLKWICVCACGRACVFCHYQLRSGYVTSCGICKPNARDRLYTIWRNFFATEKRYKVETYAPWRNFNTWASWALAHGFTGREKACRIDTAQGYGPDNLRFEPLPEAKPKRSKKGQRSV